MTRDAMNLIITIVAVGGIVFILRGPGNMWP